MSEPEPADIETPEESEDTPKKNTWEIALRAVINTLVVVIVAIVALLAWDRIMDRRNGTVSMQSAPVDITVSPTPSLEVEKDLAVELPPIAQDWSTQESSITRIASLNTDIPTRPRVDVITYTVETGDSLFSIADYYGLKPETILWGNYATLEDNPHLLRPGQVLNILPVNGTYYQWHEDDTLGQIAGFFKVEPQEIIEYPGNRFDLTLATVSNPNIEDGKWLIVPGGKRAIKDWGPPAITRDNPASASYYGSGHCGSVYTGAVGTGTFIWPTADHTISGYHYDPNVHPAIDLAGRTGDAVFATDSGVVVYSGWSDWGYGYLIVIDHAGGWQSAYAHLSAVQAVCGQSVAQGTTIGAIGNTGNSYGAHLHFELVFNGAKVNPLNFLP
jgi:murein DD-endopeptidase MepM/ murein hydrolase activator NlpD